MEKEHKHESGVTCDDLQSGTEPEETLCGKPHNKGESMIFSIEELINKKVTEREERKVTSWQASKLGSCLTGVYLERMGAKPDTEFDNRTLRVFSAGRIFEEWVTNLLENTKNTTTELQVRAVLPEYDLTGYADAVITEHNEGKKYVYEIKSKHSFGFKYLQTEGANRQHQMQLWAYLKALNIEEGRIFYVSKDDLRVLDYLVELKNEELASSVLHELSILNRAWQEKVCPPIPSVEDWRAKYCRWHVTCLKQKEYLKVTY